MNYDSLSIVRVKIERLSFNRSTNQLAYDEIPIQLAPSLETDLKRYKSGKLKIFLATQKRPIPDNILNNFINQTVIDWCAENLKDLREESECEPNYIRTRESDSFKFEYSCTPLFLISEDKTYRRSGIEMTTIKKMDGSFIVSIPRSKDSRYQLAYSEGGKLTTYTDVVIPRPGHSMRLTVQNCFPRLSSRTQYSISLESDIIFLGDWIITNKDISPRYNDESSPLPDSSLAAYVPKPLKKRLLKDLFQNFKNGISPLIETRKIVRSLWEEIYPSVLMPKTLEAIQIADTENKLLFKFFSHPTLSRDIDFKETSIKLEELSWEYVYGRCKNIQQLKAALMISDIPDITSWQDIFDLSASVGFSEAPTIVVRSLLQDDDIPS